MSDPDRTLQERIRERLALGDSPGQAARRVGTTPQRVWQIGWQDGTGVKAKRRATFEAYRPLLGQMTDLELSEASRADALRDPRLCYVTPQTIGNWRRSLSIPPYSE